MVDVQLPAPEMTEESKDVNDVKVVVKAVDMSDEMQSVVINMAIDATKKYTVHKDIAAVLKRGLDSRYGVTWHCIVGLVFGSYVTHESKHFIYFYLGDIAILAYKTA